MIFIEINRFGGQGGFKDFAEALEKYTSLQQISLEFE